MSSHELERAEAMGRVKSGNLELIDAAVILELSYRQVKRLWQRYREAGRQGLKHGNAGRPSNRRKALKLRRRVLQLIRKKYSGSEEKRFGPTLAAENLVSRRGRGRGRSRYGSALDVGGGAVEPAAQARETLLTKGAPIAFWRAGTAGWEFP